MVAGSDGAPVFVLCVPSGRPANRWHGLGRWDLGGNTNDTFSLYIITAL